jgi:hypothetical protein
MRHHSCVKASTLLLLLLLLQAVQLFGDQCQLWATFNEPTVSQQQTAV